jgi:hypothetical protein
MRNSSAHGSLALEGEEIDLVVVSGVTMFGTHCNEFEGGEAPLSNDPTMADFLRECVCVPSVSTECGVFALEDDSV